MARSIGVRFLTPRGRWRRHRGVYRCPVHLTPDPAGGFSAVVASLPGVASQGDSFVEAIANVKEAIVAVLSAYRAADGSIPWLDPPRDLPAGAIVCWVFVVVSE